MSFQWLTAQLREIQSLVFNNWVSICVCTFFQRRPSEIFNFDIQLGSILMAVGLYWIWNLAKTSFIFSPLVRMLRRCLCNCCALVCCPFGGICLIKQETIIRENQRDYSDMRNNYF